MTTESQGQFCSLTITTWIADMFTKCIDRRYRLLKVVSLGSVLVLSSFLTFRASYPSSLITQSRIKGLPPHHQASKLTITPQSGKAVGSKQRDGVGHDETSKEFGPANAATAEHNYKIPDERETIATKSGKAAVVSKQRDGVGHDETRKESGPANAATAEHNYKISFRRGGDTDFSNIFANNDPRNQGKSQLLDGKWRQMPGATKELVLSAPELFEKIPLHFLESFKNPCWVRGETELNCLPYFYIIGMAKCGTTDIYDKIAAHPDVIDVPKEPHWWGPRRRGYKATPLNKEEVLHARNLTGQSNDRSLEFYLNLYKSTAVQELIDSNITDNNGKIYHQKVFGDASISTAYTLGLEWTRLYPNASEPLYTTANLIRALQPNAKIVMMIRNPTDRANSWYWYSCTNRSVENWDSVAKKHINCFKKCLESHKLRYCAYASGCPYSVMPAFQAGIYHVYLRDWINAYSRDHVHVIRLEDWKTDPVKIYRELLTFLDLRQLSTQEEGDVLGRKIQNAIKHRTNLPQTVQAVREFFKPYNKELAKLLGGDEYLYQ